MKIKKIKIINFRNHSNSVLELSEHLNILYGLNGAGKTSVLEAVAVCSFTKTFQPVSDLTLIKENETFYNAVCEGINDYGVNYFVNLRYDLVQKKKISNSESENATAKDIIGKIPLVILTPDMKAITNGSPIDRRSFVDRLLSQISPIYMLDLLKMKQCLKQRNSILINAKKSFKPDLEQLNILTNMFIDFSINIVLKRSLLIKEFRSCFSDLYSLIGSNSEVVDIIYEPNSIVDETNISKETIRDAFIQRANELQKAEIARGTTLFGPQKDDILISINNAPAKERASQGQHKSLLISLKFAEFRYLKEKLEETPVILLDDIFSELDIDRSRKVIDLINQNGAQSIITITNPARIKSFEIDSKNKYYKINNGIVELIQNNYEP